MGRIGGFERDWSPEAFRKLDVFRRISSSLKESKIYLKETEFSWTEL
jgi:hypothetical protein